jgi:hypothetical protein
MLAATPNGGIRSDVLGQGYFAQVIATTIFGVVIGRGWRAVVGTKPETSVIKL